MKYLPIEKWTESYLVNDILIEGRGDEYSWVEFKGSGIFSDLNEVQNEISKQLSAFGNAEGGYLIFGVNNAREIDGGIKRNIIKGGIKEWLNRKVPNLTLEPTTSFEVKLIERNPKDKQSKISQDHVLPVLEIPPHEKAPVQSAKDLKFYLRISSQSHPMTKQQIFDIANRQKHAEIILQNLEWICQIGGEQKWPYLSYLLRVHIKNTGRIQGKETAIEFAIPKNFSISHWNLPFQRLDEDQKTIKVLIRYNETIFPEQCVPLQAMKVELQDTCLLPDYKIPLEENFEIQYILYCDSAVPKRDKIDLHKYAQLVSDIRVRLQRHGCKSYFEQS